MPSSIEIGNDVRLTATFRDLTSVASDPTSVSCKIKAPNGTITQPSVTRTGVGVYYVDFVVDRSGIWVFRFEGTGALTAAHEGTLFVPNSAF